MATLTFECCGSLKPLTSFWWPLSANIISTTTAQRLSEVNCKGKDEIQ
jgi:hypothetical protein